MKSLRAFGQRYPSFCWMFLIASVAVVVPLWLVRFVPFLDWPQHVGMVSFLRHQHDPLWGFSTYAVMREQIVSTYLVFYYLSTAFAVLMPVEAACKLTLSLVLVGTPAAAVYMLRAFRLPPWPALFVFVAGYNWPLYMGFLPYVQSFPLVLWGVGLMKRLSVGFAWPRWWALVGVTLLLFLSHVFAYLTLGFLAVLIVLMFRFRSLWQRFLACLGWVPSMLLMGVWAYALLLARKGGPMLQQVASGNGHAGRDFWQASYRSLHDKLKGLIEHFNEAYHGHQDRTIFWLWIGLLGGLLCLGEGRRIWRWWRLERNEPWPLWQGALLVVGMTLLYAAMPMGLFGVWWALSPRLVPLIALLLILVLPPLFRRQWRNALAYAPVLGLCLWTAQYNASKFRAFHKEAKGVNAVLRALPYGARSYGLIYNAASWVTTEAAYLHFPVYALVERGGLVGFSHFHYAVMPAKFKNIALAPYPGHRAEWEPQRWRYNIYGPFYDYLLVKGHNFYGYTGAPASRVKLVVREGEWALYYNPEASKQWPLFSFREHLAFAEVNEIGPMNTRPCVRTRGARFECPHAGWVVVKAAQVSMGGVHIPCIWAHPVTGKTLAITFRNLPANGDHIRGVLGLADSGIPKRPPFGDPVDLVIRANGRFLTRLRSMTRKGYTPYTVRIPASLRNKPFRLSFEVLTTRDAMRHFCFTATLFSSQDKL